MFGKKIWFWMNENGSHKKTGIVTKDNYEGYFEVTETESNKVYLTVRDEMEVISD